MSLIAIERKIAVLEQQMWRAAADEDFETAAKLRNEIAELKGEVAPQGESGLVRQPPPGQMGLGTHIPVVAPPSGWKRPRKPDSMTRFSSKGGRSPRKR